MVNSSVVIGARRFRWAHPASGATDGSRSLPPLGSVVAVFVFWRIQRLLARSGVRPGLITGARLRRTQPSELIAFCRPLRASFELSTRQSRSLSASKNETACTAGNPVASWDIIACHHRPLDSPAGAVTTGPKPALSGSALDTSQIHTGAFGCNPTSRWYCVV